MENVLLDQISANDTSTKNKVVTGNIPANEATLAAVAKNAAAQWANSSLTLQWTTSQEFSALSETYSLQLSERNNEGSTRPQLTKRLKELDRIIDDSLTYVKAYIGEEVGKDNASAYFSQFGIEKINKTYKVPFDRNRRAEALKTLLNGIKSRGYEARTYGTAFWQPIVEEYREKVDQAAVKDGNIAGHVGAKNATKKQIIKTLNALVCLIKANYPDTYSSELRKWGFQKEKY